jgi:uncharacterized protein (TIGR02231 family)
MKRLIACVLIAAFPAAHAADVVATLPIDHVTVYRDSAIVTRAGTVELAAGDHRLIVRNLPDGLVPAGIRIAASGGNVRLGGIEIQRVTQDALVNDNERALNKQLRALGDQRDAIQDEVAAAENQLKLLSAVSQTPTGSGDNAARIDGASLSSLVGAMGTNEAAARARVRNAKLRLRDLDEQAEVIKADLQKVATARKSTTELRASVRADAAGSVPFELEYQMGDAGWQWQYEGRLDTTTKKLVLIRQAELRQGTGEDWRGIELVVSTARPTINAATPRLASLFLDLRSPNVYSGGGDESIEEVVVTGLRRGSSRRYVPQRRERSSPSVSAQAAAPAPAAPKIEADVFATDFVADYKIPGRVSVASDRQSRVYPIGDTELAVELVARANLSKARSAYLEAKVKYKGDVPIDTGVVQLFRDDAFVGQAGLPLVLPNDEMRMPFGVDDRVRILVRDEQQDSGDRGVINKTQVDQHKRRFEVTSFHTVDIPIEIVDRVPVPRNDDIKVEILEGATPPTEKNLEGLQGVYLWRLPGTPRKTETIRHYYSVRFPRDLELAPVESQ